MSSLTVQLSLGALRGAEAPTKTGKVYRRFLGVPYAAPPVGHLRFKPPKPCQPWCGIRVATEFGNQCVQFDMITHQLVGDEDCLYLNVYTPQLPETSSSKLPVMFWIHGGGFFSGNGSSEIYGPDLLIEHNVLLVTINYRLGALGFLSTGDDIVSGNMGLKDQVQALKWVKDNISCFGGDPNNVTIFGESAGGASVHYLMMSPMAKGLFHKAIAQSGSAFCPWAFTQNARERAFRLGSICGFHSSNSQELLTFLLKVPASDLVKKAFKALSEEEKMEDLFLPFVPTIEHGENCFLSGSLLASAQNMVDVPCIMGTTSHEGYIFMTDVFEDLSKLEKQFLATLRSLPNYQKNKTDAIQKVRKFYFNNQQISEENLSSYVDLRTDVYFGFGVHIMTKLHARKKIVPTYRYIFSYSGELNMAKIIGGASHMPGASHGDEITYLFKPDLNVFEVDPLSKDAVIQTRMTQLWTNFAKTGSPTPPEDTLVPIKWPEYTVEDPFCLLIDNDLKLQKEPFKERMAFMEQLTHEIISKL